MVQDKRGLLAKIFIALMIFSALVGVWSIAFMISWPKEKTDVWKPEFRLVANCANKETCGFAYKDLADAKAQGRNRPVTFRKNTTGSSGKSKTGFSRSRHLRGTSRPRSATRSKTTCQSCSIIRMSMSPGPSTTALPPRFSRCSDSICASCAADCAPDDRGTRMLRSTGKNSQN